MLTKNPKLTENSRALRRNMTKEELHLWLDFLKGLPCNVRRQKVICNYIVDFYIPSAKLVIELDGSQHYEDEERRADMERDRNLREKGFCVLRYSNREINQEFRAVCEDITNHLPPTGASPWGEAGGEAD